MSPIPRETNLDRTVALLKEGYCFIPNRCRRYQSDIFETRLMLMKTVCMTGPEAAREFYEPGRFTRKKAPPKPTLWLLQDEGSVQVLDGEAHHWRKQMIMTLMSPGSIRRLSGLVEDHWRSRLPTWRGMEQIVLHHEVQDILCRAVCEWAGVPLDDRQASERTREFASMIEGAGAVGPRNWRGALLRRRNERWARSIIEQVRSGTLSPGAGTAARVIAEHRDLGGKLLDVKTAAVELINVLRPTVAVARFITFGALALHEHPDCRRKLRVDDGDYLDLFVQEVRRYYPFFPFVAGRVLKEFDWGGHRFRKGGWVLLDIYGTNRDPRTWKDPESFRPERFRKWDGSPYNFIAQGGGDHYDDHRCAGEWITIEIMKTAMGLLVQDMTYEVPEQNLRIDLSRVPAIPESHFRIANVRHTPLVTAAASRRSGRG